MARLARFCPAGLPQHLVQRGNNRQVCFVTDQDKAIFAAWLKEYAEKFSVAVHAWVFMTNHVHLLATPAADDSISNMMQALGRRYVRYFNHTYSRTGTLWEGRYSSSPVQTTSYFLNCQRYIELNPVRAGMVTDPAEYAWSSYRQNALGVYSALCTPHAEYLGLGSNQSEQQQAYRSFFVNHVEGDMLNEIRTALNQGMALGNDKFKDALETLYGRRVKPAKMGRPRKKVSSDPT